MLKTTMYDIIMFQQTFL